MVQTEIGLVGKTGPCCRCGPPARPTPGLKIIVIHVTDTITLNFCQPCYRAFYFGLVPGCCAFGECAHDHAPEPAGFQLHG